MPHLRSFARGAVMGRGTMVLALFLVIFMVWMSGCADVSFGSQQLGDFGNTVEEKAAVDFFKAQYGNPATNSGPPRFLEPMVSTGLVNDTPVDRVTKFSKDTGSIWFWVFYDNFKKGDPLTLTWTFNGKNMVSQERQAGGDFGRAFGEFLKPNSGWATGTHTITITGGGTSAAATFEIVNEPTETVPLPYAGQLTGSQSVAVVPKPEEISGQCPGNRLSDPDNCGLCGRKCDPAQVCSLGRCRSSCDFSILTNCDRHCVDLTSDENNCGWCGVTCLSGQTCRGGTCSSGTTVQAVRQAPGSARIADAAGKMFTIPLTSPSEGDQYYWGQQVPVTWNTQAVPSTYTSLHYDLFQDDGMEYSLVSSGEKTVRRFLLEFPETMRPASGTASYNLKLSTADEAYSGSSGWFTLKDNPFAGPAGVMPVLPMVTGMAGDQSCPSGMGRCGNGTECMSLLQDNSNCGKCGKTCPEGFSCCGGQCMHTMEDPYNCGACGTECTDTQACCSGSCVEGGCQSDLQPFRPDTYCIGCGPGACSDLLTDELNCGSCGKACSENQLCCNGTCTNILTDSNNCGGCGFTCPRTPTRTTCDMGECR